MSSGGPHHVWVGNIPYEATEAELQEILSTVGPVVSVRIRFDKETRQSKGFAFCEYRDAESCALAVAHLNGIAFGGRTLRIDFSSSSGQQKPEVKTARSHGSVTLGSSSDVPDGGMQQSLSSWLANQEGPGVQVQKYEDGKSGDTRTVKEESGAQKTPIRVEIARIVESLSVAELFCILGQVQKLVLEAPDFARSLLRENPSLCYALLHAQFICGMVSTPPFSDIENDEALDRVSADFRQRQAAAVKFLWDQQSQLLQQTADPKAPISENKLPENGIETPTSSDTSTGFVPPDNAGLQGLRATASNAMTAPHMNLVLDAGVHQGLVVTPPLFTLNTSPAASSLHPPHPRILSPSVPSLAPPAETHINPPLYSVERPPDCQLTKHSAAHASGISGFEAPLVSGEDLDILPMVPCEAPAPSLGGVEASAAEALATPFLIDHLLAHPELLNQITKATPEQEAALTPQERVELEALRKALEKRGVF